MILRLFLITLVSIYSQWNTWGQQTFSASQIHLLDSIATQDVPPGAPGIATAIIQNGRVVYEKYAGFANLSDSIRISPVSRFNIASNGKQFTALAVLTLIKQKKIRLDDDLRKFFPSLFPKIKQPIPVASLLNHTSGIRDVYDLWSLQGLTWWEQPFSNQDVLQLIGKQEDLNFEPNTQYAYSNTNYLLLALIVEKVSGQSFAAYTNQIFKQLGMNSTSFEPVPAAIRPPVARAYFNFGTWTTFDWIWEACGDGNLFTTLPDLVRWEQIVQGKIRTSIKPSVIAASQRPIKDAIFKNYGYGLEFGQYKGLDYVFHEGATGAWKATVIRFPDKKLAMITLTNTGKSIPYTQTRQMADIVLNLKPDASFLVTQPRQAGPFVSDDELTGTYLTPSDFAFTFEKRNGSIFLLRSGRNDVELEREADNIFHQKYDPPFKQEFLKNSNGEMEVTAYYTNHAPYTLTRKNSRWENFDPTKLSGRYVNSETNASIELECSVDRNCQVLMTGQEKAPGLLVSPDQLLFYNYTIDLSQPGVLLLHGDRIRQVRFVR